MLLLFLHVNTTLAWDSCYNINDWKCGDKCIDELSECKCGDSIFNRTAQMWCCNRFPCVGRGTNITSPHDVTWYGEQSEEGKMIGADCRGKGLRLTQPCNEKCNDHKEDDTKFQHHYEKLRFVRSQQRKDDPVYQRRQILGRGCRLQESSRRRAFSDRHWQLVIAALGPGEYSNTLQY